MWLSGKATPITRCLGIRLDTEMQRSKSIYAQDKIQSKKQNPLEKWSHLYLFYLKSNLHTVVYLSPNSTSSHCLYYLYYPIPLAALHANGVGATFMYLISAADLKLKWADGLVV